jgi:hypothetical protein
MSDAPVFLRCVKEGGRLRVRIVSRGYYTSANCQFPRAIRQEGRLYSVTPSSIRLAQSKNGTYFYRVSHPIQVEEEGDGVTQQELEAQRHPQAKTPPPTRGGKKPAVESKKRKPSVALVEKPRHVFDHEDEPDCVVCLVTKKEKILVPCGHFCLCGECIGLLPAPKKCPMCRVPIKTSILPSEL